MWMVIGFLLIMLTLPGVLELALLTLGGVLPVHARKPNNTAPALPLAILVPAHNEAAHIERCLRSLQQAANELTTIIVIADNCSDNTAEIARQAGVRVIERHNAAERGKGFALAYAIAQLWAEDFAAFVIVDADTIVAPNFVTAMQARFADRADAVQCRYGVLNAQAAPRTRLLNIALLAFNVLRPRGRERWGLSAGLLGNGFGLARATLAAVQHSAHSIVEDLEYHLKLVRAGRRVQFADETTVLAEMPVAGAGVTTQRARWEGGKLQMLRQYAGVLLRDVFSGRWRLLEPLLELLLLPLAFHVALLLGTLGCAWLAPLGWLRAYACFGLLLTVGHVVAAVVVGGGGWRDWLTLARAPFYILWWKLSLLRAIIRAAHKVVTTCCRPLSLKRLIAGCIWMYGMARGTEQGATWRLRVRTIPKASGRYRSLFRTIGCTALPYMQLQPALIARVPLGVQ